MSEKFDPNKHLRVLKGKGGSADYLDVKWRLVWLRSEHPDAVTGVEHIEISPDVAIFKATVSIPGGGTAIDYGSETPRDFGDYIEKAATKSLGRALAQLGYGTQFVGFELDENTRIVDSPVQRKYGPDLEAEPAPSRPQRPAAAREAPRQAATPAPPPDDGAEDVGAYSWTTFWSAAREAGLRDWPTINQRIGEDAQARKYSPEQVRDRLRETGVPL